MRSLLQVDEEDEKEQEQPEISLGAASLLGLFIGLVLICGVFFGLGYAVGRRPSAGPSAYIAPAQAGPVIAKVDAPKPSATPLQTGSQKAGDSSALPAAGDVPAPVSGTSAQPAQSAMVDLPIDETPPPELKPSALRQRRQAQAQPSAGTAGAPAAAAPIATAPSPASAAASARAVPIAATSPAGTMVQVAAVAHQEDAAVLVTALRQKGYSAVVRTEAQDKWLHVQIGPYTSRAEASAVRQKLLSDGYNAILK